MEMTPMMRQYLAAKEQNPGTILFFRLGDFYEMFFDDAKLVSKELGLTLTSRSKNPDNAPMCGVPYHAAETYVNKLVQKGYKVAIAEQIGDPKAKGLTKREVIKIITPGTVLSEAALKDAQNNYIALVYEQAEKIVLTGADISTGECFYGIYQGPDRLQMLQDELYRLMMPELLLVGRLSFEQDLREFIALRLPHCSFTMIDEVSAHIDDRLVQHFDAATRPTAPEARAAVATLLDYLHETVKTDLTHLNQLTYLDASENLVVDTYTLRNLEITRNLRDGGKKDTLLDVLDFTETAMGSRLLKKWLEYPLLSIPKISRRQDAVEEFAADFALRGGVRQGCKEIHDFERLLTRIEVGTANARDLIALKISLMCLPGIKENMKGVKSELLRQCAAGIECFAELVDLLERSIVDEPGISLREGGIIKTGYNEELDEYRRISHDSKAMLQEIEEREREQTGIKTLKIGYNKVFGYYIEVRHSGTSLVPDRYIRKQTLANAERYITEELKEFETKILGAQEKIVNIEYNLFTEVRETIKAHLTEVQQTAHEIALVDVLASLAEAASTYHYVRPQLTMNGAIDIKDGRHPLVERILTRDLFVPNDTQLDHHDCEIMLITGPNMAGKSTYMRQVALLTLMAQIGSFIPAREASISPVDRIFTRIGASDDLVSGQSTFMVEMNEVAQILKYATKDSLVILDEIGRGTSTFDGMSIARAVIEYIEKKVHAKTLFATHYHELTDLEDEKIKNYCVAVKERGKQVAFLRRIIKGAADKSYGIHVARLAGLPKSVTARAEEILAELEAAAPEQAAVPAAGQTAEASKGTAAAAVSAGQKQADASMGSLFSSSLASSLLALDVMTMTPLEAMNALYKLQEQAKREEGQA
ncbi:DNA mismatch repair protein MutS [Mitsuokella sp. AF21-1AC]|uniref:DNA mismatch repair protein MutS n=1 Tax=Mitsuokella sp. AF21-1AC TaxID=2292235 RepID=UPI000E50D319|nr:DNA mismatch repair protein MutS [Mitsuokella sp. AF21-1AC]RGS74530.1 DNA mismatch repair protein MutS [Mitsuokella sp. AF21-1AC]